MRVRRGSFLILLGVLLIAAGGLLSVYNLREEYMAGSEVQETLLLMDSFYAQMNVPTAQPRPEGPLIVVPREGTTREETPIPVYPEQTALQQEEPEPVPNNGQDGEQGSTPERGLDRAQDQLQGDAQASGQAGGRDEAAQLSAHLAAHAALHGPQSTVQSGGATAAPVQVTATPAQPPQESEEEDLLFVPRTPEPPAATPEPQAVVEIMPAPDLSLSEIEIPNYILNPRMDMPVIRQNGQDYIGVLEIPSLNLQLPIISEWNYSRLKKAPCRYSGSAYLDNLVIAAHNYKTHFGRLKNLDRGDLVVFTDADGNRFEYAVVLRETLMPRDVQEMKSGEFDLSLFTCTVGGSYRVTVRCDRIR